MQNEARRPGERDALVVAEERVGRARPGELALLEPAQEDRAVAPGADLERVGDLHAPRARGLAERDLDALENGDHLRGAREAGRPRPRELRQLRERVGERAEGAGVGGLRRVEPGRAAAIGADEERLELAREPLAERGRPLGGCGAQPVDVLERPAALGVLPQRARRVGARDPGAADRDLERVGELEPIELPGVRSQARRS